MSAALWSAGDAPATLIAPPDSVDCHHHVYDHRFPWDAGAKLQPPEATVAHYRLLQRRLGIYRSVVVQPSSYGSDNRCLMDALAQLGDAARGVAVIDRQMTDADLREMHEAGVRGIRLICRGRPVPVSSCWTNWRGAWRRLAGTCRCTPWGTAIRRWSLC